MNRLHSSRQPHMVQSLLLPKQQQSRSFGSKSFLFGDNRSVVTSNTLPHSTLTKHHNILAKTATGQIMDIRQTLRFGAPIGSKSFLLGDNGSVVTSATLPPHSRHHNILAFHRVREAIAAKLMAFYWIPSASNFSDMLSKLLQCAQ